MSEQPLQVLTRLKLHCAKSNLHFEKAFGSQVITKFELRSLGVSHHVSKDVKPIQSKPVWATTDQHKSTALAHKRKTKRCGGSRLGLTNHQKVCTESCCMQNPGTTCAHPGLQKNSKRCSGRTLTRPAFCQSVRELWSCMNTLCTRMQIRTSFYQIDELRSNSLTRITYRKGKWKASEHPTPSSLGNGCVSWIKKAHQAYHLAFSFFLPYQDKYLPTWTHNFFLVF